MQVAEPRPPYVTFETRAVEDRDASLLAGHFVTKDVDFAVITPQGSKDRVERIVSEWFEALTQHVQEQRFPSEWLRAFREAYTAWKEGREIPTVGTPVLTWPVASPAQVRQLLDLKIRTVEDLAGANEETLGRLGMGGRALKDRAKAWLETANSVGKVSEEVAALRLAKTNSDARSLQLEAQVAELSRELKALKK